MEDIPQGERKSDFEVQNEPKKKALLKASRTRSGAS
jgi:hypothetical protein